MLVLAAVVAAAVAAADDGGAPPATAKMYMAGKLEYEKTCAACHGVTGEGNGPVAFAVKPPPRNFRKDPFKQGDSVPQVFWTITHGLADSKMVGYPTIDETVRWGIAYYVVSFRPKK